VERSEQNLTLQAPRMPARRMSENVVSPAPHSAAIFSGLRSRCRGRGFVRRLAAVQRAWPRSDASTAFLRLMPPPSVVGRGAPSIFPWHSQASQIMADMTNNREKTSGLAPTASSDTDCWSRPEGVFARDAKAPSALSDQSSRRRERVRGCRGTSAWEIAHRPAGRENPVDRSRASTSPAHHFRLLSGTKNWILLATTPKKSGIL
jgi:hypothetical protein